MADDKREIRNTAYDVVITDDDDKRTVDGYALLFDTRSDRLDFEEVIEPGALDGVIERSDVMALLNHDINRGILARCKKGKGSLTLTVDAKGLRYTFEAPHSPLGEELLENLRRGEVSESSFAFDVEKDTWEKKSDGTWKRTIHQFGHLYDVSPVYTAAYSATSVNLRGLEAAKEELAKKEAEEARKAAAPDEKYFENLSSTLNF